jgi:hypothetical protein
VIALLLGCRPAATGGAGGPVDEARLEHVDLHEFALFGGGAGGSADLVVRTGEDEVTVPVSLAGGTVGLAIQLVVADPPAFGPVTLDLPDHPVPFDQLLGRYSGNTEGLGVIVGVEGHHLQNRADVRIDEATVAIGVDVAVAWGWLTLALADGGTS